MILAIRTAGDSEDALHAAVGEAKNSVLMTTRDGESPLTFPLRSLYLTHTTGDGKEEKILELDAIKATAVATDSRFAFACSNFDKGGGWVGLGVGVIAMNAGSKLAAAFRSRGQTLTGQVRYAWLSYVGGHSKTGWTDKERLVFATSFRQNGQTVRVRLECGVTGDLDSSIIAAEIARRAARYRLEAGDGHGNEEERKGLEELTRAQALTSTKGKYAIHEFPTNWHISESTADLAAHIATGSSS